MVGMVFGGQLLGREFRTPLPWVNGIAHYPLDNLDQESDWSFEGWAGAYSRTADRAYKNGTNTTTLARLLFCQECFRVSDSFANRGANANCPNPFVKLATVVPEFKYDEQGVVLGGRVERKINSRFRAGLRTAIPFRRISTSRIASKYACDFKGSATKLEDVVKFNRESHNGAMAQERWAFRLDILSALTNQDYPAAGQASLVNFAAPIRIDTNQAGASSTSWLEGTPGLHVKRSVDGSAPSLPCGELRQNVDGLPVLSGDGTAPAADDARAIFDTTTNYAALGGNLAAQSTLWVVPTITDDGTQDSQEANDLRARFEDRMKHLESSGNTDICKFFEENCLCFDDQSTSGVGDWQWDAYVGFEPTDWIYVNGVIGFSFPTAGSICNPGRLFLMPRGNNGHYELKLGLESGWSLLEWLAVRADASYTFAFKDEERINASFCGACVKNLGPCTVADIGWGTFHGRLAATIFYPKHLDAGFTIGYELTAKSKDTISFRNHSVKDFCGSCEKLDNCVAERCSDRLSHVIRGEFFYRHNSWYVSAGASHVFAGRNAPRESDIFARLSLEY